MPLCGKRLGSGVVRAVDYLLPDRDHKVCARCVKSLRETQETQP